MKKLLLIALLATSSIQAQTIVKSSIDSGGGSVTAGNIQMLFSIGEVMVQERSAGNIQISEGFINPQVALDIKIAPIMLLEGPITNATTAGLMNDDLRAANSIPTLSPYPDAATCDASVFTITGNDAIVDWVYIQLRDENDNSIIETGVSALLQRDGDIVATDGVSTLSIAIEAKNYFVSINHRNHLGLISSTPIALSGATATVDFKNSTTQIAGGSASVTDLNNGTFAAIAGDVDGNGQIQNSDLLAIYTSIGGNGYLVVDTNLNAQNQNSDVFVTQPNVGKAQQFQD